MTGEVVKDIKEKTVKEKRTGSNAVDIQAGAAAREERKAKEAKEVQEKLENISADTEKQKEKKAHKKDKKEKALKEKSAGNEDVQEVATNGTPKSTKHKKEKKTSGETAEPAVVTSQVPPRPPPPTTKMTPLQSKMAAKLASARFRFLNEQLYTTPSADALDLFHKSPGTFEEYHSGFRQQVDVWPSNPVDGYIANIKRRGAVKGDQKKSSKKEASPLPRTKGLCTIADLGCGDAKLASDMSTANAEGKLNVKILSYDLHSPSPLVERADIANLPLEDGNVNVVVFCLALMGTNWPDFIDEAYRILHWKGELWIAEIKSRFGRVSEAKKDGKSKVVEHSVGNRRKKPRSKMSEAEKKLEDAAKQDEDETLAEEVDGVQTASTSGTGGDETDVSSFIQVLASRGFVLDGDEGEAVERGNKMFVKMRFLKAAQPTKGKNAVKGKEGTTWKPKGKRFLDRVDGGDDLDEGKVLKPCVYKLR